jgi:hypothetical protein
MGMSQSSLDALTRQFRNATLGSSDALNASIHLEHTRIFTFVEFLFTTVEISIYTKRKFTLNKRKVRLQQIKKLNFVEIQFNHNRSSATHSEHFSCMSKAVQVFYFFLSGNPSH